MSTSAAEDVSRFVHEAAIYDSDEQFLATVVPFLRQGVAVGEPTLVGTTAARERLLRDSLGDTSGLMFLSADASYADGIAALKANRDLWAGHLRAGAAHLRMAGEIPEFGLASDWDQWCRYEAAVGQVCAPLPVYAMCLYDTRITPAAVLDDVRRTHPRLATAGAAGQVNAECADAAAFLTEQLRGTPDPLERTGPAAELVDPQLHTARVTVADAAAGAKLDRDTIDDVVLAVNEAVTNGYVHGRRPVVLRIWATPGRVVATVSDRGPGPPDPFVGLLPRDSGAGKGGLGLWMTHKFCTRVDRIHSADGFTLRLIVSG